MDKQLTMRIDTPRRRARRGIFGLSIIGIGVLALLDNLRVFDIALLRTFWPLVFVLWGAARLAWGRHAGSRLFGMVLVLVGALMTAHNLGHESLSLRQWWPVFIILAGASIALRGWFSSSQWDRGRFESSTIEHTDEVNVDATFSGVKLQNDSRSFKGGRIAMAFGGLELDLREAVMEGAEATIHIDAKFSGIELRVPRDWQVMVQMNATMGAVEDKSAPPVSASHRLVLRGETIFGGVEIKN
jgi:predicted membrane protein